MPRTTKQDLVQATAEATGRTQQECRIVIHVFMKKVLLAADAMAPVEIRGFGTFYVKERKPRPARNPRTGEVVPLPRRRVFLFRFSPHLVETIGLGIGLPYASPVRFENLLTRQHIAAHARTYIGEEK